MSPFLSTIRDQRKGKTSDELDLLLQQVVQAVQSTGKPGHVTLKLTVNPVKKGVPGDMIILADKVKAEVPEMDREASIFFVGDDGTLSRQDTRQRELGLRSVEIDHSTGEVLTPRKSAP